MSIEREYLRSLLAIRAPAAPRPAVERALALLVELVDASAGQLELGGTGGRALRFVAGCGGDPVVASAEIVTWSATGTVSVRRDARLGARELELFELFAREVRAVADRLVRADLPLLRDATRRMHEQLVVDALLHNRGNVSRAARALGVSRTFVYALARAAGARRSEE